jgi:hypothetical protein
VKKLVLGAVFGGIILFVFGSLSWMVLPWHAASLKKFANGDAVAAAVTANAAEGGVYINPFGQDAAAQEKMKTGPMLFVSYRPSGVPSMTGPMIEHFLNMVLVALLATWLVGKTTGLSYWGRVVFITVMGFTAGIYCVLPNWTWWGFSSAYTLSQIADTTIGAFVSGLAIAKVA